MKTDLKNPLVWILGLHVFFVLLAASYFIVQKAQPRVALEKIVVLPIEGTITHGKGGLDGGMSVDEVVKYINKIAEEDSVKALVLRINSPGGSVGAVQDIHRALQYFRSKNKFVVSSFGDVSASGGYYVAVGGDYIFANPGTLTGSIGVIVQLAQAQGLLRKIGVDFEVIKSGKMKDAGSPFRELTSEERRYFQTVINEAYGQFLEAVVTGRKAEKKDILPNADGRILSGSMAVKAKLVDELGGLKEAVEKAKALAGLTDKDPEVVYKKRAAPLDRILALLSHSPLESLEKVSSHGPRLLYMIQ